MTEKMINALKKFDDLSDPNNTTAKELASEKKIQNAINRELSTMKMADKVTAIEEALEFMNESRFSIAWANVKAYYREKLSDYLDKQSDEDPINPDRMLDKTIKLATNGRKVQKDHKKHARKYLRSYSGIKKEYPLLSYEEYIRDIGMTEVSNNTYRKWMENFDEAEEMLLND